jgi:hypothetical protein
MPQAKTKKAELRDLTFDHEGAHVALCKDEQGFSANGRHKALITKALAPVNKADAVVDSEEAGEVAIPSLPAKIQEIMVTLDLPDFLQRFFGMYSDDAMVLAMLLGYECDDADIPATYDDYLEERVESFQIMQSLYKSKNIKKSFSALSDESKLSVLADVLVLEKTLSDSEKTKNKPTKEGKDVPDKKEIAADDLQKALNDQAEVAKVEKAAMQADLQKALDVIKALEDEKKAVFVKAKTDKITAIVKNEADKAIFVKAALVLEDEDYNKFAATLEAVYKSVEDSAMFREVGSSGVIKKSAEDLSPAEKTAKALNKLMVEKYNLKGNE